jgi:hypothetical protein
LADSALENDFANAFIITNASQNRRVFVFKLREFFVSKTEEEPIDFRSK